MNKNFQDWELMDQILSIKVDKIIEDQSKLDKRVSKLEKIAEESLNINKQILSMLQENRDLYTSMMQQTLNKEEKTIAMLNDNRGVYTGMMQEAIEVKNGREEAINALNNDKTNIRLDNALWRTYTHGKDPYKDPTFGVFIKNVLFGTPTSLRKKNLQKK
jgi:hypothetical protein